MINNFRLIVIVARGTTASDINATAAVEVVAVVGRRTR